MVEFLYTRIILVFAAIGLVSMGISGGISALSGQPLGGLATLLIAAGIGYFWYHDWVRLGKCAKALAKAKENAQRIMAASREV